MLIPQFVCNQVSHWASGAVSHSQSHSPSRSTVPSCKSLITQVTFRCFHGSLLRMPGQHRQLYNTYSSRRTEHTISTTIQIYPLMLYVNNPWLISNLMHKILIYLHIIHLLKSSTCFEHCPAHLQEVYVVIVYMQLLVSSLSAGDCPVHRLRKNSSSFLTGAQDSHLQRMTTPEAAYIQLRLRLPEDEQGNARNM